MKTLKMNIPQENLITIRMMREIGTKKIKIEIIIIIKMNLTIILIEIIIQI